MSRLSYLDLLRAPAWYLLDVDNRLLATVRAQTVHDARFIFKRHGMHGAFIRGPIYR